MSVNDIKDNREIRKINLLSTIEVDRDLNKGYFLNDEDIVFVRSNGSKELVGRYVIVFPQKEKITFSGFCIRFRKNTNQIKSSYLIHLLTNTLFKKTWLSKGRGCNINNINQQMLAELPIPLPPLSLQTRFAVIVEKIEHQKALVKKVLQESEDLFQRLMQDLFRPEQENGK